MSRNAINIRLASQTDLPAWQEFVDRTPAAGALHHAGWHGVLCDAYWVRPLFLMAFRNDARVEGVLPAYLSRSPLTGPHISSLEGGALACCPQAATALIAEASALRDRTAARYFQLRGGTTAEASGTSVMTVRTVIATDRSPDVLWAGMKQSGRRAVRKGEKEPVVVEQDPLLERLEEFYTVYAVHMHKLGTPVMGVDAFSAMRKHLGRERLRLYLVRHESNVIGGMLCIVTGDSWTSYFAAVAAGKETEFANYTLYWYVIRDASSLGVTRFDLGRSTRGSTVHLFKQRWGGTDVEVPYHFYRAPGARRGDVGMQKLKAEDSWPQRIWSRLPLALCNRVGPLLRKQLPFI